MNVLNKLLQALIKKHEDTGWVNLPLSRTHMIWTVEGTGGHVRARKIGNLVELSVQNLRSEGVVQRKESVITSGLPESMKPGKSVTAPVIAIPGAGSMMGGTLRVHTDGLVTIEPLATGDTYVPSYGVFAHVTYLVN